MRAEALPSVSVVVPTKNRPDEIARMLASLRAQPTLPLEVIVVDQSTPAYALEPFPELRHVHDPKIAGITAARNHGVELARGDVVLFLDDDIVLESDCVREIARAFADRPDVVGAQCAIHNPWDDAPLSFFERSERVFRHGFFNPRPWRRGNEVIPRLIDGLASAYRRSLFARECFDERLPGYGLAEDWDMTKRAARHGALTTVLGARVRHLHSQNNRADLATIVKLRRRNFMYLYDKLEAGRDVRNRFWKAWFLFGEFLRSGKQLISGSAAPRVDARRENVDVRLGDAGRG